MQENNRSTLLLPVIVRAWGDEPVKLFLHRIENNRCYVGQRESRRPIGLPFDEVFAYDEDRFVTLSTSFQHGDLRNVSEIYANISVDDFACNKYQDVLRSRHDQKNITDTGLVESGDAQ